MKILLIDSNIMTGSWGAGDLKKLIHNADSAATVFVRRSPHDDLPLNIEKYDKVILSGSITQATANDEWIKKLEDLINKTININKPILGVCYGHQMIARTLGGVSKVGKAKTPELGWTKINIINKNSIILKGLPEIFYSYSSHFDEVCDLPENLTCSASSSLCGIQSYESKNAPVFGIQFHPEKTLVESESSYQDYKKRKLTHYYLNHDKRKKVYNESIGITIFKNFLKL